MKRSFLLLTLLALFIFPALLSRAQDKPAANQVTIENFTFTPPALTVPAGSAVTWTNKDDMIHLIVIDGLKKKSAGLDTDDNFSVTFDKPGKYAYYCGMHPKMTGVIIVK